MLHHDDIVFRTLYKPLRVSFRCRLPACRETLVLRQAPFEQERTFVVHASSKVSWDNIRSDNKSSGDVPPFGRGPWQWKSGFKTTRTI
jgi:hypothetical protein